MNTVLLNSKRLILTFGFYVLVMAGWATPSHSQQASILKNHDIEQAIDIAADSLEVHQSDNLAIFKGSVVVTQGNLKMTANDITVFYDNSAGGLDPTIARIDATGEVKITSSAERAEGDWGIYDVKARLITMGGNVVLQRGESIIIGERLELDLVTGITKIDGEGLSQDRVAGKFKIPKKKN
jgi:lipopolysaccharide export system protein LptA